MIIPIELTTRRLILRGITPALIHELYNTRTKEEIIKYFGFDEAGYEHLRNMHEKGMETKVFENSSKVYNKSHNSNVLLNEDSTFG
jgi:hypothetical protein